MVLKTMVVDDFWVDVDGERSDDGLQFMALDVVQARHRSCAGVSIADPQRP